MPWRELAKILVRRRQAMEEGSHTKKDFQDIALLIYSISIQPILEVLLDKVIIPHVQVEGNR